MARKIMNGLDLQSQKVINLASPSASTDAANKSYVDNLVNGLTWKQAVRAATTTNGTLSTAYANGQVIDGVTLATGDRILLKNQTTGSENGLYTVNVSGAPTRSADGVTGELTFNSTVYASEGTTNADTAWTLTTNGAITVGTTSTAWAQVGGGASYTAGNGISLASNIVTAVATTGVTVTGSGIGVDFSVVPKKYSANIGDGSSTAITVTHGLGTRDVAVTVYDASSYDEVWPDVNHATTTTLTVTFATAPASNAYRIVVTG